MKNIPCEGDSTCKSQKARSWSQVNHHSAASNETYQERLARLEGDKESLILQVSVLTDQVEAQGEKIRDLEVCLEGHQVKLNAAEEMLQQVGAVGAEGLRVLPDLLSRSPLSVSGSQLLLSHPPWSSDWPIGRWVCGIGSAGETSRNTESCRAGGRGRGRGWPARRTCWAG
uniref:PPFIA binding protein 2 n=1 Tax=Molossus molossus TaxID=27622 RepID=A0A7J8ETR0_MOLMO|nr:PPFIA binding protein 2 [Molossus molossus]